MLELSYIMPMFQLGAFTHLESFPNRIILLYPEDEVFVLAITSLNVDIYK